MLNILKTTGKNEGLRVLKHGDRIFHDALSYSKGEDNFNVKPVSKNERRKRL